MLEGKRIFIPDIDSYFNKFILNELRNDNFNDQELNNIQGTLK
jgi:hypothetical protein